MSTGKRLPTEREISYLRSLSQSVSDDPYLDALMGSILLDLWFTGSDPRESWDPVVTPARPVDLLSWDEILSRSEGALRIDFAPARAAWEKT